MKLKWIIYSFLFFFITSCGKENLGNYENSSDLAKWFGGKYKVITVVAEDSLDLNRDGIFSRKLTRELDFSSAFLFIEVSENENIFRLTFPEAYVPDEAPNQSPTYVVQGENKNFLYNPYANRLVVTPQNPPADPLHDANPTDVIIVGSNRLQVQITKNLYTSQGMKKVKLIIDYLRTK